MVGLQNSFRVGINIYLSIKPQTVTNTTIEVIKAMPQIESLGLLGSLGQTPFYGENTGDGRLKV
jgi:hypothetical protein